TNPRVATDVRGHRRAARRRVQRLHVADRLERRVRADTEIHRQDAVHALAIDEDVLAVERDLVGAPRHVDLIEILAELAPHLTDRSPRAHAGDKAWFDVCFDDFIARFTHESFLSIS